LPGYDRLLDIDATRAKASASSSSGGDINVGGRWGPGVGRRLALTSSWLNA
jgi:hypothetical protein